MFYYIIITHPSRVVTEQLPLGAQVDMVLQQSDRVGGDLARLPRSLAELRQRFSLISVLNPCANAAASLPLLFAFSCVYYLLS